MPILLMWCVIVGRKTLYSFQSWNSALFFWFWYSLSTKWRSRSWWQCLLDVLHSNILQNSSWCLPGVRYLGEKYLRIYSYDWSSTFCCCYKTVDYFMTSSRSQHAPSATSETLGSITYYIATRVRISNTHLWWIWRCWSRHKCSTESFVWASGIVSALFETCCWSEYIGIRSDGYR